LRNWFSTPYFLIVSGAVSAAVLLIASLSGAALSPVRMRDRLRLARSSLRPLDLAVVVLGFLAFSECSDGLFGVLGWQGVGTLGRLTRIIGGLSGGTLLAVLLVGGLGAGVAEELFFRGYLQTRLAERWGARVAILVTALAFGLVHFDLLHSTFAFGAG